ncbi:MAG: RNA methyltransferase [Desulfuromonadales bacterium]|nr:RNA methyltransferase [Desulfuromonadales bacterium]
MNFDNVSIVLVEPQGERNIGSVCRAMMNFGFRDLRLVNPQVDHRTHEARQMAVKAGDLLDKASLFDTLETALADCRLAIGTTRRFGKYRETFLSPEKAAGEAAAAAAEGRVALVFGREDRGLHADEIALCQLYLTIPTRAELPSMNLAQAVSLCLYEFAKFAENSAEVPTAPKRAPIEEVESLFAHMKTSLLDIEYLDPKNPDHIMRALRRIFGRSGLSSREVRILRGLFSRIDWVEAERRRLTDAD